MKVAVKDLEPNPYRNMKEYPIDTEKLETLKNSIKETFFWDNLLARKSPDKEGKLQIAYGHHRLRALRDLRYGEVDIPVKKINDPTMLKIMADENAEEYGMDPEVLNETILAVKKYLDGEIKGKEWGVLPHPLRTLFPSETGFQSLQVRGVGEATIKAFLGENWSIKKIRNALADLRARGDLPPIQTEKPRQIVDKEASKKIKTSIEARGAFRKAVQDYKIPAKTQREIATSFEGKRPSATEVRQKVRSRALPEKEGKADPLLKTLIKQLELIHDKSRGLTRTIQLFRMEAQALNVEDIGGIKGYFVRNEIAALLHEVKALATYFGIDHKTLIDGGKK